MAGTFPESSKFRLLLDGKSIRYDFFNDLESIQHKLSSDYSLNICFSRRFPSIDVPSFSYKMSVFDNMQFFPGFILTY